MVGEVIRLTGVSKSFKSFGDVEVLRCIDLSIREGEFVVIAGENGSGKTTLKENLNVSYGFRT